MEIHDDVQIHCFFYIFFSPQVDFLVKFILFSMIGSERIYIYICTIICIYIYKCRMNIDMAV